MRNLYQIYLISDSTGETLDRIFLALKAQFPNFEYETNHFSFTRTESQTLTILKQAKKDKNSIILSVGEKDEVSIEYVARQIAKAFDYEHMIEFDSTYSDGQFKKTADNSKLLKLYGEYKFIDFEDGIKKSVEWFIENFDSCRK